MLSEVAYFSFSPKKHCDSDTSLTNSHSHHNYVSVCCSKPKGTESDWAVRAWVYHILAVSQIEGTHRSLPRHMSRIEIAHKLLTLHSLISGRARGYQYKSMHIWHFTCYWTRSVLIQILTSFSMLHSRAQSASECAGFTVVPTPGVVSSSHLSILARAVAGKWCPLWFWFFTLSEGERESDWDLSLYKAARLMLPSFSVHRLTIFSCDQPSFNVHLTILACGGRIPIHGMRGMKGLRLSLIYRSFGKILGAHAPICAWRALAHRSLPRRHVRAAKQLIVSNQRLMCNADYWPSNPAKD